LLWLLWTGKQPRPVPKKIFIVEFTFLNTRKCTKVPRYHDDRSIQNGRIQPAEHILKHELGRRSGAVPRKNGPLWTSWQPPWLLPLHVPSYYVNAHKRLHSNVYDDLKLHRHKGISNGTKVRRPLAGIVTPTFEICRHQILSSPALRKNFDDAVLSCTDYYIKAGETHTAEGRRTRCADRSIRIRTTCCREQKWQQKLRRQALEQH
jgi:hypothetical protein